MTNIFRRFAASRRSAVAVIMAISLVPLMLLVGIAVDFTFLYQSRTQTAFASQAAATQALRIAAATYALEVANAPAGQSASVTNTQASAHAIAAGQTAGNLWFLADLGSLSRATMISAPNALTTVTNTNPNGASVGAPIFTASVSDTTSYPPIFNPLFKNTSNWVYTSNASGTTSYAYAQILLMLDTSGSMLIGAEPSDILTMEEGTVCPQQGYLIPSDTSKLIAGNHSIGYGDYNPNAVPSGAISVPLAHLTPASYSGATDSDVSGKCNPISTYKNGVLVSTTNYGLQSPYIYEDGQGGTAAGTPCALACHFSTATAPNGYSADYYGLARAEGVTLRLDVLFSATESVITDMSNSEAIQNQLSVGVYQFNTDVFPIVTGATGTNAGTLPEATSDLSSALAAVQNVDFKSPNYQKTTTTVVVPQVINHATVSTTPSSSVANIGGDTNLPLSLIDLQNGKPFIAGGKQKPLTVSGNGATSGTPLKFIFIVTDGFEDDSYSNGDGSTIPGYNVEGQMTSISGEAANNLTTGTCATLKNTLGYTVYVLYVDYYPLVNTAYYNAPTPGPRYTNSATNYDNSNLTNASVQSLTYTPSLATSATAKALQACASSPADFQEANSAQSIKDALAAMLKSALASTIRLTN